MPTVKYEFKPHTHKKTDYRNIYKHLTDRFKDNTQDCPAVLLLSSAEPVLLEDIDRDSVIILDRDKPTLKGDLKRSLSKSAKLLDQDQISMMQALWSPSCNYGVWYLWLLAIGDALKVEIPAFFICDHMPLGLTKLRGAILPGGDTPYVTDVLIRLRKNHWDVSLKTLLHEMRHVWQHKYHNEMFRGYYKYTNKVKDTYSLQPAEIDADAYAYWVLEKYGITSIPDNLGEARCAAIKKRMLEISEEETVPNLSPLIIKNK